MAAAVVALSVTASARADHGTIHDPVGDTRLNPPGPVANWDITRATWGHAPGARLVHEVSVKGSIGSPGTGTGSLPQLQIDVGARSGCRYVVTASRAGGELSDSGCAGPSPNSTDDVSVKKVDQHTLKYVLTEDAIGGPKIYRWQFVSTARDCHCVYDRAPNDGPKFHNLAPPLPPPARNPIENVVVIYQENHTFDNVLGRLCARTGACDGATEGTLPDGSPIPLKRARDIVPVMAHGTDAMNEAIDGGRMDGFALIDGCRPQSRPPRQDYGCFTQYTQDQIPNLWKIARSFVISDRTFQLGSVPSYGAHLELVSTTLSGFMNNPEDSSNQAAPGWGCDSHLDAPWQATPSSPITLQPACVPWYGLNPQQYPFGGAYRPTQVPPTTTIMDRLEQANLSWRLYAEGPHEGGGYLWAICPYYAKCLYTQRRQNQVDRREVVDDARAGTLPNFSVVLPNIRVSQHNSTSMKAGDNWIGQVISSIEHGPEWRSTAIFILYDDCGCYYDHVPPPPGLGIRTPMVIVSPWARPGYVDSNQASIASMLAFTEQTFGLKPLTNRDRTAYDYSQSFDFDQRPIAPIAITHSKLTQHQRHVFRHPPKDPEGT